MASTTSRENQKSLFSLWFRGKTLIVTTLVGWIPLSLGQILRNLLYRTIVKQIGFPVWIRPNVEFTNPRWIAIDNRVSIARSVCIDILPNNDVYLGKRVKLERGVRLSCQGKQGRIFLKDKVCLDRDVDIKVHQGGQIAIGEETYIGSYTCISGYGKIEIGNNCTLGSHVAIYAHNHDFSDPYKKIKEQGFTVKGVAIEDDCCLGNGVKVVDGVTIGKGSIISAGAVVTKDIPPYSVAAGVPAKVISQRG
ncbi:acyltransferase [Myxosarcina sp. GI1]|uniref:acyltransferase n=1 Tax=Myxosarcina sp. GI1 TaxID=1541065 RepID=UPI0005610D95|nr:acyltransferase [Myxosarcina sp. GI1]